MTEETPNGALRKYALYVFMASAVLLCGCTAENASLPHTDLEPTAQTTLSVGVETSASSSAANAAEESTLTQGKPDISDTQTVSEGDAASKDSETERNIPQTTAAEELSSVVQTEVSEQTNAAVTEPPAAKEEAKLTVTKAPVQEEPQNESASSSIVTAETAPAETTAAPADTAKAPAETAAAPAEYSKEFFENDLFIGDSISTGYSLYGLLPEKNVFAKVGLNPSTVLTRTVATCYGEIGVGDMVINTMPERIYIMLGSNGIQWLSVESMLSSTDKLKTMIGTLCSDAEIVIVSVPPVTYEYDCAQDEPINGKIDEYNASLSLYCRANGLLYVDISSELKDDTGYFDSAYAESDGMHFKISAYKAVLGRICEDVTEFEAYRASTETAEAEENENNEDGAELTPGEDNESEENRQTSPWETTQTDDAEKDERKDKLSEKA